MAFSIQHLSQNGFDIIELADDDGARVQVIPSLGALLHGFIIPRAKGPLNVIDSYGSMDDYNGRIQDSFKSAKLSPFACRIKDAVYQWNGVERKIQKSPIHGLLYDQAFTLILEEAGSQDAVIDLEYHYNGWDPGYPFPYTCNVRYRLLAENTLEISTSVLNHHTETIPVMDGWHPYFTTGGSVDELELQFWSKEMVEFDEKLIPTGKVLPYTTFTKAKKLEGVQLDNSFLLDFTQPSPLCTLHDPREQVTIEFHPSTAYPVLQVYTPPHRRSIAIENLTGAPNAFNNGLGLVKLAPGESLQFSTTLRVRG
ncbi:aldose 1-epimerase [Chitinophaga alhagiae]|uniref:aldose 1-epimerase n=1 Tax=Chitinophaga alhagiae TaxID=2203219 RepID=UPI00130051DB|nr:aldose 1-epimerase [Chitinophaga alhagiae]